MTGPLIFGNSHIGSLYTKGLHPGPSFAKPPRELRRTASCLVSGTPSSVSICHGLGPRATARMFKKGPPNICYGTVRVFEGAQCTWTPKLCLMMVCWALSKCFGLCFNILLKSRYVCMCARVLVCAQRCECRCEGVYMGAHVSFHCVICFLLLYVCMRVCLHLYL